MQSTLLAIAIAMIAALVAALVGPLFIDWGRYRATFEAEASRMVGQPVSIGGAIDVRLLPTPSVLLHEVEIGRSAEPVFSVQTAGFDLALSALMRGQWRASSARLDAPVFSLGLDASGGIEGAALLAKLDADQVSIDQLDVTNGRVVLADAASRTRVVLEKLSFAGEVRGLGGPIKGQGSFANAGKSFSYRVAASRGDEQGIHLRLGVDAAERPLTLEADLTLTNDKGVPHYDGAVTVARIAGMALSTGKTVASDPWRIGGKIKGDSKSALIEQIDMRYGPEERAIKLGGTANMSFGAKPRLDAVLSARQLDVDRVLASTDAAGRVPAAVLRGLSDSIGELWLPPIELSLGIGIESVTLGGAVLQSVRGDFKAAADSWSVDTFEFRAPGGTQIKLSGRIEGRPQSLQFAGPVAVESFNPRALMTWVNGGIDRVPATIAPLRARGDLAFGPQQVVLDHIVADYDRKAFEGRLAYVYAAATRPARLDATLNAAEFDLDGMRAILESAFAGGQFAWPGELALSIGFDRATFSALEAKSVKADLRWEAAGLRIERLSVADFGGASISASGQIDMLAIPPRGSIALWIDAQKLDGVAALIAGVAPSAAEIVRRSAPRLTPAKIEASVKVDPASAAASGVKNVGKFTVAGTLGGVRVNVSADASGDLAAWPDAYLRLDGRLAANDSAVLSLLGLQRLGAAARTSDLTFNATGQAGGNWRVDARLGGGGLDAIASGTMRIDGDGPKGSVDIAVNSADVRSVRVDAQPLPLAMKSRATFAGSTVTFADLTGTVAGSPVSGRLTLALQPLRVEGAISSDALNVPAAVAAIVGLPAQADAKALGWPAQPFGAGLFADTDGRIEFDAAQAVLAPGVSAQRLHGLVRFKPAELTVDNVTGSLGDGSLAGWARFRTGPGGLTASGRVALSNANAASVIVAPNGSAPLTGRLSSQIEMEGTGSNAAALVGALRGKGSLTFDGVQIAGLDTKVFDVANRAVERGVPLTGGRIGDVVDRVMDNGTLSVSWASAPVDIASGRVRLGKLIGPPRADDLTLSGSLDLVERTLDMRLTIFGPPPANAAAPARPEITVGLKGPIGAPRRSVDVTALVGWLTLQSVDRTSRRLEVIEPREGSGDNVNAVTREDAPRSTSSVPATQAPPPLPPSTEIAPAGARRLAPPAAGPRYGTASSAPVPLPPGR